jgi:hypothetical protein
MAALEKKETCYLRQKIFLSAALWELDMWNFIHACIRLEVLSSGFWCLGTSVSEEHTGSILRVEDGDVCSCEMMVPT